MELAKIKQRLELLYQEVEKLEREGGGGGGDSYTKAQTDALLDEKVNKVTGKGLSTNDFTDADKAKLSGIAAGAEVNVQSNWAQTDTDADDYIKNKPILGTAAAKGVDTTPTASSTNLVESGGVASALAPITDLIRTIRFNNSDPKTITIPSTTSRTLLVLGFLQGIGNVNYTLEIDGTGVLTVKNTYTGSAVSNSGITYDTATRGLTFTGLTIGYSTITLISTTV